MATVPEPLNITIVQGQSFLYVFKRVQNAQTITLVGGPSSGTWQIKAYGSTVPTAGFAYNASAATVQTALQLIPKIGGNGVAVGRSGAGTSGDPYIYTLTWAGHFLEVPAGQKVPLQPLVDVIPAFSPASVVTVDWVPFDFTSWTARMTVSKDNGDGTFTEIVEITDSTTAADPGKIYIGWVDPTSEGGTPGTVDPTNGKIGLLISAAKTAALTQSQFLTGTVNKGRHVVIGSKSTWSKAFYEGTAALEVEPT